MPEHQVQEITMEDFFTLCKKGGTYQIETPGGWKDVGSLVQKNNKECYTLVLENGMQLGCSFDHYVWASNDIYNPFSYAWKKAEDINVQTDFILTKPEGKSGSEVKYTDWQKVVAKEHIGTKDTFDLEVKSATHEYYSNGIVSHNTGKSMTCDALAAAYEMPLLRLDFGAVFSSHIGESEQNIRQCLAMAEAVSPAILWIDEVEKGIGAVESSNATDGGVTNRVFGTMLTWMQDKTAPVFVVCTANNVFGIPPEFMRAGRFDEIFFIDLPNDEQREEITEKLLRRKKRKPENFEIDDIVSVTKNYAPVEIEKGIDNGLFVAYADGKRELTTEDIVLEIQKFSPLYNLRREEIDEMRRWAIGDDRRGGRAVLANTPEKTPEVVINESGRFTGISV